MPADHPLRPIRALADEVLPGLNDRFEGLYSGMGRPSIPPEMLLRASLLQAFFSVRSERMLMEQIDYNLLFRWFVGLEIDAPVWHPTVFTHNRDRLMETAVARAFLSGLLELEARETASVERPLLRRRHADRGLGVDEERPEEGRLGRASGAGPQTVSATSARRSARTRPTPRPRIRMPGSTARGTGRRAVCASWPRADGEPPRPGRGCGPHPRRHGRAEAALLMLDRRKRRHRITLGADKAYDVEAFVHALRARRVSPHVTINGAVSKTGKIRKTALDGRTTHHAGYAISLRCRKRIEEAFGWIKAQAGLRKVKLRGRARVEALVHLRRRGLQPRAVAQADGPDSHLIDRPAPGGARDVAHPAIAGQTTAFRRRKSSPPAATRHFFSSLLEPCPIAMRSGTALGRWRARRDSCRAGPRQPGRPGQGTPRMDVRPSGPQPPAPSWNRSWPRRDDGPPRPVRRRRPRPRDRRRPGAPERAGHGDRPAGEHRRSRPRRAGDVSRPAGGPGCPDLRGRRRSALRRRPRRAGAPGPGGRTSAGGDRRALHLDHRSRGADRWQQPDRRGRGDPRAFLRDGGCAPGRARADQPRLHRGARRRAGGFRHAEPRRPSGRACPRGGGRLPRHGRLRDPEDPDRGPCRGRGRRRRDPVRGAGPDGVRESRPRLPARPGARTEPRN